jgi:hypothetical protein
VRLRIVVRSLAVILASPLVALPAGWASEDAGAQNPGPAHGAAAVAPAAEIAPKVVVHERSPSAPITTAPPANPAAEPTEISVACGGDGCVVQSGLEVMVVAGKRAR